MLEQYADPRYASALGMNADRYRQALTDLTNTVSLGNSRAAVKESIRASVARIQAEPPAAFAEGGWGKLFTSLKALRIMKYKITSRKCNLVFNLMISTLIKHNDDNAIVL